MVTTASPQESGTLDEWTKPPFLRRVRIRGYKSIAFCDVPLQPLTVLVGRNGSGKSNFLDALAFLRDTIRLGVLEAVGRRGNMQTLLCRSAEANAITIGIEASFTAGPEEAEHLAGYRLHVPASAGAGGLMQGEPEEWLSIEGPLIEGGKVVLSARHRKLEWIGGPSGLVSQTLPSMTRGLSVLYYLGNSPYPELADSLQSMGFYNFQPEAIRRLHKPNPGWLLGRDGGDLPSHVALLKENDPERLQRLKDYLLLITPEVRDFDSVHYGEYETIRFRLAGGTDPGGIEFDAASMSDGTLRALAALVAAFQFAPPHGRPSVIGIEEPETSLHPAATRSLIAALQEATTHTQVLLTTHSADLLADRDLALSQILVVRSRDGQTRIAPVDAASREIVRKELYTVVDLQRMDQLDPDATDLARQAASWAENGKD